MGKQKITVKRNMTLITNTMGRFERINPEEWKILTNRVVRGLAPVQIQNKWNKTVLSAGGTGWVSMNYYMAYSANRPTLRAFLSGTMRIAQECEKHGLRVDNLCWEPDKIFVDGASGQLIMLYWPMVTLERPQSDILRFYWSLYQPMVAAGFPAEFLQGYNHYFYQRSVFDLHQFSQVVQPYLKSKKKTKPVGEEPEVDKPDRSVICDSWLESEEDHSKIWINRPKMILGRDRDQCDILIDGDISVSRRHAKLQEKDGQYYLTDLGSSNGTFVGKRLQPGKPVLLENGMQVRFGDVRYRFMQFQSNKTIDIHRIWGGK